MYFLTCRACVSNSSAPGPTFKKALYHTHVLGEALDEWPHP